MNVAIDSTKLHIFKFKQPSCLTITPFELADISDHKIIPLCKIRRLQNEEENSLHLAVVSIIIYTGVAVKLKIILQILFSFSLP